MKIFFVLLAIVSNFAFAGTSHVSKGDLLKNRQYQTNGNLAFFVDPTGNDANQCTGVGTDACLTLQGAFNKAPKLLKHQVVVTAAAGNYAGVTISGFTVDPSVQRVALGILLTGALANVTPTTGSASFTSTAGSAGSGITFGTVTDGAATWTVNDAAMVGKFVTCSQGQTRVIISNTATVLTIAGTWTSPTGACLIQSPSVNITTCVGQLSTPLGSNAIGTAGIQLLDNDNSLIQTTIQNINISGTCARSITANGNGEVLINQVTASGATAAGVRLSGSLPNTGGLTSISNSYINQSITALLVTGGAGSAVTNSFLQSATIAMQLIGNATGYQVNSGIQLSAPTGIAAYSGGVSGGSNGLGNAAISGVRCDCASAANSRCVEAHNSGSSIYLIGNVNVTNCTEGFRATYGAQIISNDPTPILSGNALAYATNAMYGGQISFRTDIATITGATAEMTIDDGAATATFASLPSSYSCLTSMGSGSKVCRK